MNSGRRQIRNAAARVGLDALAAFTRRGASTSARHRIGIFLMWGIGDAVLSLPLLRALRATYPQARIEGIGKPFLPALFADEGLFDGFHVLVPPWTKPIEKYRLWSREWRDFAAAVRRLAQTEFDLLVSPRPDPRDAALARCLSTAEFAGYGGLGGKAWISVDLGGSPGARAPVYRGELAALAAEALTGLRPPSAPSLTSRPPPDDLTNQLAMSGYRGGPVLAVAFGAAHPIRRWGGAKIAETLGRVQSQPGAYLQIASADSPRFDFPPGIPLVRWQGPLADLKQTLTLADVLFCADSGTLHLGAALGCRTVSVFGPGLPAEFAPPGELHAAYAVEPMPCRPCYDRCIHPSPLCMDRIDTQAVATLIDRVLSAVDRPRATVEPASPRERRA